MYHSILVYYPIAYTEEVDRQVLALLELNIIEVSKVKISLPIVCMAKKDAFTRLCIENRVLNSVTHIPSFPMKDLQEIVNTAGATKHLSSIDLSKRC